MQKRDKENPRRKGTQRKCKLVPKADMSLWRRFG